MPVLDIKLSRVRKLLGRDISLEELDETLFKMGFEIESATEKEGDVHLKIEITPDRPDMLSSYGFVRALKKYLWISPGLDKYEMKASDEYAIIVDESVGPIRPYIAAAVVKNVTISEEDLDDLIYAQEKLHDTFCRGRRKASIGLYPLDKITWPLRYYAEVPEKISFRPLGFEEVMTADEILKRHPKGVEYGHLLRGFERYPLFVDGKGNVLSMPPIINSEDFGKVTVADRNVLIEVTGTHKPTVEQVVSIMAAIFADMGGEIYKVRIKYPHGEEWSPYLEPKVWKTKVSYINSVLGLKLNGKEIKRLLRRMGLDATVRGDAVTVYVPGYRTDIWHPVDIADEVGRAFEYDNMEPELTPVFTVGGITSETETIDYLRELAVGLGYLELFTFALTSKEDQFEKMLLPESPAVEIYGAKEAKINIVRVWLLPEVLKALAYNKDAGYPVKVFEVADVVLLSPESDTGAVNETRMCLASAHTEASYTEVRRDLEHILRVLGFEKLEFKRAEHPSFVRGRVAKIIVNGEEVGIIGEVHPRVILNWGLSVPIAAAEISVSKLFRWKYRPVRTAIA